MVTLCMSRSAGCQKNRRAISPSSAGQLRVAFHTQHLASPLVSIHYKHARTHESHLFPVFSKTSGPFLGHRGWVGVSRNSQACRHLLTQLLPATYTHASLRTRHCVPNAL